MLSIVVSLSCLYLAAEQETQQYDLRKTTTIHHTHSSHHQQKPNQGSDDAEVAKMAISTLASMAMNILNIGTDPHNPQAVGSNVMNILSSFINFVTFAMKNPGFVELMNEESFKETLRCYIVKELIEKQEILSEDGERI